MLLWILNFENTQGKILEIKKEYWGLLLVLFEVGYHWTFVGSLQSLTEWKSGKKLFYDEIWRNKTNVLLNSLRDSLCEDFYHLSWIWRGHVETFGMDKYIPVTDGCKWNMDHVVV